MEGELLKHTHKGNLQENESNVAAFRYRIINLLNMNSIYNTTFIIIAHMYTLIDLCILISRRHSCTCSIGIRGFKLDSMISRTARGSPTL